MADDWDAIHKEAEKQAQLYGINAVDALHIAATVVGADEFVTAEREGKPLFRTPNIRVVSIRLSLCLLCHRKSREKKMRNSVFAVLSLMLLPAIGRAGEVKPKAEQPATFPFVLPWDDSSKTATDVSFLNPTPAGNGGFIKARNGHFYDGSERRVRFLGVNIAAGAAFPDKKTAGKVAARLHKFGINIVRFHHIDAPWSSPNIFANSETDTLKLSPDSLDRLDYFIAQLKKNGVYANLNLHVSRTYRAADGIKDADKLPELGKVVTYFLPRSIELQKEYARQLLTHKNPYTGKTYAEEPAVAVVEMNNENTLLGAAWDGGIDRLHSTPKDELQKQWNEWLARKYGTVDVLRKAWRSEDKPLGEPLIRLLISINDPKWVMERNQPPADAELTMFSPPTPAPRPTILTVNVKTLGAANWHLQLHRVGLDLKEGEPYTLTFEAWADKERTLPIYSGLDQPDWHHTGLDTSVKLTPQLQTFRLVFTAVRAMKNHNRLSFVVGDALGKVMLRNIKLQPGVVTELPTDVTLEEGNIPLIPPSANPAGRDLAAFLMETEKNYVDTLYSFLKTDLKVHANVMCSQGSYGGIGGLLRESRTDFVDMHAYWQHPDFPGRQWDMANWRIGNSSMIRQANGGTLSGLAQYRLADKPFTVTEYSHPAPNDYQAETVPLLAAYAALQDWDGIYLFDYTTGQNEYNDEKIKGFFAVDTNPAKMALVPAAALLFLRGDLLPARREARLTIPEPNVAMLMTKYGNDIAPAWEGTGTKREESLTQRFSVRFTKEASAPPKPGTELAPLEKGDAAFDWNAASSDKPVVTAESPSLQMMVGFLGGQSIQLHDWNLVMPETPRNFAAVTLSALDRQPISQSKHLLLTAVGAVENQGMKWNASRTSVGADWGTAPTVAEGIPAAIIVRTTAKNATVFALDGTGKRQGKVPAKVENGTLLFSIGAEHKTLWYEIEAKF